MSLALSKHKRDSWKRQKSRHWKILEPQKWMARSWYILGRKINNANLWLEAFWCNSVLCWFKVVFQKQLFFSCTYLDADYVFKQININLQGVLKIKHRILPTFFTRARPSSTRPITCRCTALFFISCEGQLENL